MDRAVPRTLDAPRSESVGHVPTVAA
jgi:hypothetical protein